MSPSRQIPATFVPPDTGRITRTVLNLVSHIPDSAVAHSDAPSAQAQRIADQAGRRAALTAGSLALPPGPLGWLTVLPELLAIWKIQRQMVSDIAAAYGKHAALGRQQMLYCLFRHSAAQAFRDVVVRTGDRLLFRRATQKGLEYVAQRIGLSLSQRALSKSVARWLPLVGAAGVAWYARYDTRQVARTAMDLFAGEVAEDEAAPDTSATEA